MNEWVGSYLCVDGWYEFVNDDAVMWSTDTFGVGELGCSNLAIDELLEWTNQFSLGTSIHHQAIEDLRSGSNKSSNIRTDTIHTMELTQPDTIRDRWWNQRGDVRVSTNHERKWWTLIISGQTETIAIGVSRSTNWHTKKLDSITTIAAAITCGIIDG